MTIDAAVMSYLARAALVSHDATCSLTVTPCHLVIIGPMTYLLRTPARDRVRAPAEGEILAQRDDTLAVAT